MGPIPVETGRLVACVAMVVFTLLAGMIYPAVIASVACLVGVSLMTPPSPEKGWRPFMETA